MGHYRQWLRHVLEIDRVVWMGFTGAHFNAAYEYMVFLQFLYMWLMRKNPQNQMTKEEHNPKQDNES